MADALNSEFPDADIKLVKGEKGVFDVAVDDKVVYSKSERGKKSERGISLSDVSEDEIVEIIEKLEP